MSAGAVTARLWRLLADWLVPATAVAWPPPAWGGLRP